MIVHLSFNEFKYITKSNKRRDRYIFLSKKIINIEKYQDLKKNNVLILSSLLILHKNINIIEKYFFKYS